MKYGIVAFPSKKLQDFANSYRKRYDTHFSKITPHITLKSVFEVDDSKVNEVTSMLQEISKQFKPLSIHVSKVSSFAPVNNAIYLKVEPTEQLQKLYDALHAKSFGQEPEYKFVPHITIAQDMSSGEHDDIYGQLRMTDVHSEEVIDRIHLLYQLEDGSWTVYETFRLSGAE
jgi:2'-5' RNA ligase